MILVDVGGGGKGGSPARPVEMGRIDQITEWNHAVWPLKSKSAGKFYVFGGDETSFSNPRLPKDQPFNSGTKLPTRMGGWLHVVEFDDLDNPQEVASYKVGDYGVHNYWIDWDLEILYVAYYQGGLRVLDVSGELLGDLYAQGREIGRFLFRRSRSVRTELAHGLGAATAQGNHLLLGLPQRALGGSVGNSRG